MIHKSRTAVLIAGMHRSGTSAIAGFVNLLGVDVSKNILPATLDNPFGYWESSEVVEFHDQLLRSCGLTWDSVLPTSSDFQSSKQYMDAQDWIEDYILREFKDSASFLIKDPRICRFLSLWTDSLKKINVDIKVVLPFRSYNEVVTSLNKREMQNELHSGNPFSSQHAFLLWIRYILESEKQSREFKRSFVSYHNIIKDWRNISFKLSRELGITWSDIGEKGARQIDSFITPKLNRSERMLDKLGTDAEFEWTVKVYSALELLELNPYDEKAMHMFDEVSAQIDTADSLYGYLLAEENGKFKREHLSKYNLEKNLLLKIAELEHKLESLEAMKNQSLREKENEIQLLKSHMINFKKDL